MADLHGRVALVTGSSSGIGAAIATALAERGASIVVNSSSSVPAGERLAAELPRAAYVRADISDPAEAARLVTTTVERYGRLDILVNNAGTTEVIPHHDLDACTNEIWERIFRVNVLGTWNVIRPAAPHLRAAGDGVIVNITSLAGVRPTGSSIPYAVSKARCASPARAPCPSATLEGPARVVPTGISADTGAVWSRIPGMAGTEPPAEADLTAAGRVIIEITVDRVYGVSYIKAGI